MSDGIAKLRPIRHPVQAWQLWRARREFDELLAEASELQAALTSPSELNRLIPVVANWGRQAEQLLVRIQRRVDPAVFKGVIAPEFAPRTSAPRRAQQLSDAIERATGALRSQQNGIPPLATYLRQHPVALVSAALLAVAAVIAPIAVAGGGAAPPPPTPTLVASQSPLPTLTSMAHASPTSDASATASALPKTQTQPPATATELSATTAPTVGQPPTSTSTPTSPPPPPKFTPTVTPTPPKSIGSITPENGGFYIRDPGIRIFLFECTEGHAGIWIETREDVGATRVEFQGFRSDGANIASPLNKSGNQWLDDPSSGKVEFGWYFSSPDIPSEFTVLLTKDGNLIVEPFTLKRVSPSVLTVSGSKAQSTTDMCTGS